MPMVAWYMLSNESYMKRVMRDVLPTIRRQKAKLASAVRGFGDPDLTRRTTLFAQEDQPADA